MPISFCIGEDTIAIKKNGFERLLRSFEFLRAAACDLGRKEGRRRMQNNANDKHPQLSNNAKGDLAWIIR